MSEQRDVDEVTRLSEESLLRIDLAHPGTERFVTLNGLPLRKVRGFVISSHVDRDGILGRVDVRVECIAEPIRLRADLGGAVLHHVDGDQRNLQEFSGILVNETDWAAFAAWRTARQAEAR